jgi:hypothetical protein
MTAPAPLGLNVINNHIAKWAPSRHDGAVPFRKLSAASHSGAPPSALEQSKDAWT